MSAPSLAVVVIGGPRHGQGFRVDATRLRHGVVLPDQELTTAWDAPPMGTMQATTYRWETYSLFGLRVNLLVHPSVVTARLHEHLGVLLTPIAQEAWEGTP